MNASVQGSPISCNQNEGQRKRVPGTCDEERHYLTRARAALVELGTNHQNAVAAQIEQHAGQRRPHDPGRAALRTERAHDKLAGNAPEHGNHQHTDGDAPPDGVHELEHGMRERLQPGIPAHVRRQLPVGNVGHDHR